MGGNRDSCLYHVLLLWCVRCLCIARYFAVLKTGVHFHKYLEIRAVWSIVVGCIEEYDCKGIVGGYPWNFDSLGGESMV